MKNKFDMTTEENIFLAKRNIVDYIWKSANLEGVNVTFPQTYAIYEKAKVNDVSVNDILTVVNLKHAWQTLLDGIHKDELDISLFCKINAEVSRDESLAWGALRTGEVSIGGTSYIPPIPDQAVAEEKLRQIISDGEKSATEKAIEVMAFGMKSQLFWDGNKRTSMLVANKLMIENGCGIISVPVEQIEAFNTVLSDYYTYDKLDEFKQFVYDHCLDGISFAGRNQSDNELLDLTDDQLSSGRN